jgi:hypothetical protein
MSVQTHSVLFEMLAPSLQGPVYVTLVGDGRLLKIGGEFNLSADQVETWISILEAVQDKMKRAG